MSKRGLTAAFITALITIGTALMVLFGAEGVNNFSDITPVSYANCVIGGLVAGLTGYKARLAQSPSQPKPEISGPNQSGEPK